VLKETLTLILAADTVTVDAPTRDRCKNPLCPFADTTALSTSPGDCINSGLKRIYVFTQYKEPVAGQPFRLGWNIFRQRVRRVPLLCTAATPNGELVVPGDSRCSPSEHHILREERPGFSSLVRHVYKMATANDRSPCPHRGPASRSPLWRVNCKLRAGWGFWRSGGHRILSFDGEADAPTAIPSRPGFAGSTWEYTWSEAAA